MAWEGCVRDAVSDTAHSCCWASAGVGRGASGQDSPHHCFHNCSSGYCSSSDPRVFYKPASFREPTVPRSAVTGELDSPCVRLLRDSQACERDSLGLGEQQSEMH